MKRFLVLTVAAFLVMMVGIAQADVVLSGGSSDIHVNDGTAYLFSGTPEDSTGDYHVHALTDPSTVTLQGSHNGAIIDSVYLVFAVPGYTDSITATANGVTGTNMGDLTSGMEVYGDVLNLTGGNNSESFTNFTMFADQDAKNFDIYVFDLGTTLSQDNPVSVSLSGVPLGTYVFAYGFDNDKGDTYFTPFTQTGLTVPEPGMLMLFGSSLLGIGLFGRKKINK